MRTVMGPLSLVYGIAAISLFAFTGLSRWLPIPSGAIVEALPLANLLAVASIVATSLGMAIGGGAMLLGRRWSVRLLNRAATGLALALFCYFSLGVVLEALQETANPVHVVLSRYWTIAIAAAALPLLLVWWTGRNVNVPIEQLSWNWQQNKKRGRHMSGRCRHCGAMLNFASGDGVQTPDDQPFKLLCSDCNEELFLSDVD